MNSKRPIIIVSTRPLGSATEFIKLCAGKRYSVLEFPAVSFAALALDNTAQKQLQKFTTGGYDCLVLSSQMAVKYFAQVLKQAKYPETIPTSMKVGVVGESTAGEFEQVFRRPADWVPALGKAGAKELISVIAGQSFQGKSVLFPCADKAREEIAEHLRRQGAELDRLALYQTVPALTQAQIDQLRELARNNQLYLCFYSPSAFQTYFAQLGSAFLKNVACVSIGETTSHEILKSGLQVAAQAESQSQQGMFQVIEKLLAAEDSN